MKQRPPAGLELKTRDQPLDHGHPRQHPLAPRDQPALAARACWNERGRRQIADRAQVLVKD